MRETFRTAWSLLMRTTRLTPGSTKTKPKGGALEALCTAFSSAAARGRTAPSTVGQRQTTTAPTATERSWNAGRGRAKCRGLHSHHSHFSHLIARPRETWGNYTICTLHLEITWWQTFSYFVEERSCIPVTIPLLVKIITLWWGEAELETVSSFGQKLCCFFVFCLFFLYHWT